MLLKCKKCGAQVKPLAKFCPKCKQKWPAITDKVLIGAFCVAAFLGYALVHYGGGHITYTHYSLSKAPAMMLAGTKIPMPETEAAVVGAIEAARQQYVAAPTVIARNAVRPA